MEIFIYKNCISSTSSRGGAVVVTLLGLKDLIARGYGPGVIDLQTLTPSASQYWREYKSKVFPNEKNKSYPLD